jgi:hypothetical protein
LRERSYITVARIYFNRQDGGWHELILNPHTAELQSGSSAGRPVLRSRHAGRDCKCKHENSIVIRRKIGQGLKAYATAAHWSYSQCKIRERIAKRRLV